MKKGFTLLFVLFFCFRLTVLGIHPGTIHLAVHPDTPATKNQPDSAKAQASLQRHDQINFLATANQPVRLITDLLITDKTILPLPEVITENLKQITSGIQLGSLKASLSEAINRREGLKKQIKLNEQAKIEHLLKSNDPDSLKMELKHAANDTLKALLYTRLASLYSGYDTISGKKKQLTYQNEDINYTILAIQQYAAYNDSTALRRSFDNLAKVYYAQKKYSQAKWFILQSNTLSRAKNDIPNIISSLITLSLIKREIKDYQLAMDDLSEALQLSIKNHSTRAELEVLKNYALLYHKLNNYPKEAAVLKKRDSLLESLRKNEEAKLAAQNSLRKKKLDSLQNKKKVYSSNMRKLYKNNSSGKIVSL